MYTEKRQTLWREIQEEPNIFRVYYIHGSEDSTH